VRALGKDESTVLDKILAALKDGKLALLMDDVEELLGEITKEGGAAALAQIGIVDDDAILELVNRRAVDYALDRAAEMVGKKWIGDELVENPNAEWRIDDATRELLRGDVSQAMEEGWSNDKLAESLEDNYAFSEERAEMIARTETAFADVQGNLIAYRESNEVAQKQWIVGADCCDECQELDEVVVDLDDDFPGEGGEGPPLHPHCQCDVVPILKEAPADDEDEQT
jgi:SPP1 gp7 family putative phage head morphogenesis protein